MKHKLHQEANDWATCKCGKLFADDRGDWGTKYDKLRKHMEEKNATPNLNNTSEKE